MDNIVDFKKDVTTCDWCDKSVLKDKVIEFEGEEYCSEKCRKECDVDFIKNIQK